MLVHSWTLRKMGFVTLILRADVFFVHDCYILIADQFFNKK